MKQFAVAALLLCLNVVIWAGEPLNYNGYLVDTSNITTFRADSLKYSRVYSLSQYENSRIRVCVDDTSAARFASDSVKFYYFVQIGSPCLNSNNKLDTAWNNNPLIIDTVDFSSSGCFTTTYSTLLNDYTYTETMKLIDTSNVTGFATNSHTWPALWDVFVRVGVKGLTGNNKDAFLKLRIDRIARNGVKTVN